MLSWGIFPLQFLVGSSSGPVAFFGGGVSVIYLPHTFWSKMKNVSPESASFYGWVEHISNSQSFVIVFVSIFRM